MDRGAACWLHRGSATLGDQRANHRHRRSAGFLTAGGPWWFGSDVPANGRRASMAMSGPLGCRRRIECDKEYLCAHRDIELVRSVQVLDVREPGSGSGPQILWFTPAG